MMAFLLGPLLLIGRNRRLLTRTTMIELKTSYAGSILGIAWVFLSPIFLLSIYAIVYAYIFRVRPEQLSVSEYILYVFSGLVPFLAFSSALTLGTMSLVSNRQMLFSTVFPPDLIPLRAVIVGSASLPVGIAIVMAADAIFGHTSSFSLLCFPFMVLQLCFLTGICWILSLLTLLIRDISQILQYVNMILLIATPIAYTPDMVPEKLRIISYINPLFYFTTSFQYAITYDQFPPIKIVLGMILISMVSFYAGFWIFQRLKTGFYDYV